MPNSTASNSLSRPSQALQFCYPHPSEQSRSLTQRICAFKPSASAPTPTASTWGCTGAPSSYPAVSGTSSNVLLLRRWRRKALAGPVRHAWSNRPAEKHIWILHSVMTCGDGSLDGCGPAGLKRVDARRGKCSWFSQAIEQATFPRAATVKRWYGMGH